jgi:hypothetical protein
MDEYPKMLFKAGGSLELAEGKFSFIIVNSSEEEDAAEGWEATLAGALELANPQANLKWEAPSKAKKSAPPVI